MDIFISSTFHRAYIIRRSVPVGSVISCQNSTRSPLKDLLLWRSIIGFLQCFNEMSLIKETVSVFGVYMYIHCSRCFSFSCTKRMEISSWIVLYNIYEQRRKNDLYDAFVPANMILVSVFTDSLAVSYCLVTFERWSSTGPSMTVGQRDVNVKYVTLLRNGIALSDY